VDLYIHSSMRLHGVVLNKLFKHRDTFTFTVKHIIPEKILCVVRYVTMLKVHLQKCCSVVIP
jgi:hypothetical protein